MKLTLKEKFRHFALNSLYKLMTPIVYENVRFLYEHRYWPYLHNPRSFSEFVVNRKLYAPLPDAAMLADKYAVREFVKNRMGNEELLNPMYWVGDDLNKLDWNSLPSSFVAKNTCGSGKEFIIIVRDKSTYTEASFKAEAQAVLDRPFGDRSNEAFYKTIKPKIIIEKLMVDTTHGIPIDYKFYTFHGRAEYIHVDQDRFTDHNRMLYDRSWNLAPFWIKKRRGKDVPRPAKFDEMLAIADKLATGYSYMRVDLYLLNNEQIVFGEMTMTPGGGQDRFYPSKDYDFAMGKLWSRKA